MKFGLILPVLAAMVACSGDKDSGTETEEAFAPTEGAWSYGDSAYANDNCNFSDNPLYNTDILDALVFTLANESDEVMTLTSQAGTAFDCTRDEMNATCTNTNEMDISSYNDADGNPVVDAEGNEVDPDATATVTLTAAVVFSDSETASYTATIEATCAGTDCPVVLDSLGVTDNPCTSDLSGSIVHQAE